MGLAVLQGKTAGESDNDDSCNAIDDPRRARPGKPSLRGVGSRDDEGEPGQFGRGQQRRGSDRRSYSPDQKTGTYTHGRYRGLIAASGDRGAQYKRCIETGNDRQNRGNQCETCDRMKHRQSSTLR